MFFYYEILRLKSKSLILCRPLLQSFYAVMYFPLKFFVIKRLLSYKIFNFGAFFYELFNFENFYRKSFNFEAF